MKSSRVELGMMWVPRERETVNVSEKWIGRPITIYPDGYKYKHYTTNKIVELGENVGCFKHYYRVLSDLVKKDCDIVGVLSDDIIYKDNWLETALTGFDSNTGFVAIYTPKGMGFGFNLKDGWNTINKGWGGTWGGGYLFKKEVAIKLLEHPFILNHLENYAKNQQIDHAIPEAIFQMGLDQKFHAPSLCNHIGYTSTIGHTHRSVDNAYGW